MTLRTAASGTSMQVSRLSRSSSNVVSSAEYLSAPECRPGWRVVPWCRSAGHVDEMGRAGVARPVASWLPHTPAVPAWLQLRRAAIRGGREWHWRLCSLCHVCPSSPQSMLSDLIVVRQHELYGLCIELSPSSTHILSAPGICPRRYDAPVGLLPVGSFSQRERVEPSSPASVGQPRSRDYNLTSFHAG